MRPLEEYLKTQLAEHLNKIEEMLDADVISIISPILSGLDNKVREAIENLTDKKKTVAIIHDTPGGVVEVVERMVDTIRHWYKEVIFLIPDRAMSAGTIFALSADKIYMDYYSCLGPIDPQIERDGRLVPALAYLNQFEKLNQKSTSGSLTSAEYALLSKLDLGELYQFDQARELSIELLKKWLSKYKFKNWNVTETKKTKVTSKLKEKRAKEIAELLNDSDRWHSHGRGINMITLQKEINLKINNFSEIKELGPTVKEYFELLTDYMKRENYPYFVHTKEDF